MDSAANPDTAVETEKASWLEIVITLAIALPLCFFMANYAKSKMDDERTRLNLEETVDEVAANLRVSGNLRLDELPSGVANGSAVIARVVKALDLHQIAPADFEKRIELQKGVMATFVNAWRRTGELQPNEPASGVFWREGTLRNTWGGTVTVYRKGDLMLVALTGVPKETCESMHFRRPLTSYLFACNDDVIAVEEGGSSHVDVPKWLESIEASPRRAQ